MPSQPGFWRKCRVCFRWFRISVLALVLALLGCAFWLNRIGLPDFLKDALVQSLRARGVEVQFTRLRWRFVRGLVAEDVRLGLTAATGSPTFFVHEAQLRLDYRALLGRHLQVEGLILRDGQFTWPILESNAPPRSLTLDHLQTDLRFQTNGTWSLDHFQADFAGARLTLSGEVAHASLIRRWPIFHPSHGAAGAVWQARLRQFSDALDQIHFQSAPDLNFSIHGDARDLNSFRLRLTLNASGADTPWGRVQQGRLLVRVAPAPTAGTQATALLATDDADTPWCRVRRGRLIVRISSVPAHPPHATLRLEADDARSRWAGARHLELEAGIVRGTSNGPSAGTAWGAWAKIQPYRFDWTAQCTQLRSEKVNADTVACDGNWSAPELRLTRLSADLGGGRLDARGRLNVVTRRFNFTNSSSFDLNAIAGLLTEKTRLWLARFSWAQPPRLRAGGSLTLPAWTNCAPDWRGQVQPTERLAGSFELGRGSFDRVPFDSARSSFSYSNLVWQLPDLAVAQPEGLIQLAGTEDDRTKFYHWHVRGALDPAVLRPQFETRKARHALNLFTSTQPARVDADVWGRLYDYDSIGARGRIALTNFTFRGEAADYFESAAAYTNRVLQCFQPDLRRGGERLTADGITVDFNAQRIYFTNGFSTAEPQAVARAIGPKVGSALAPYHFLQPPTVRVSGYAPLRGDEDADLRFDVDGGPLNWLKLKAAHVSGEARWLGHTLILTNLTASLYGGNGGGSALFHFHPPRDGAEFQFSAGVTNVDVHRLASELASPSNHLEGVLAGRLVVTRGDTQDWRTWNGRGSADLRNGLLWDIPIFGILSVPLNTIVPGLGSSRATDASAQFVLTNGVIFSDKLEVRSTLMRLDYAGSVDLTGEVNARATARLLRNTWVIGPLISTALWPVSKLFEYRITGTLEAPHSEPLVPYLPQILLWPLHPIRSIEELFPSNTATNAPGR
ncbi:MAG: hypothetical protein KGJ60_03050 [Verrucomicrobiota bacterium]|nr:hypothetical protein [Verrucomicrobiota bacterium]